MTARSASRPAADPSVPLESLLVANRGEIARRIFTTARSMGLSTTAVYSANDGDAPFVSEADQAVQLTGGYLDIDEIIEAARLTGAQCVHPGYGFLSENPVFAQAVIDAGLIWVGPSPKVIETMGDKIAAKEAARAAGVPVLVSTDDPSEAGSVGFPLLVKASAGGGGKGMRLVADASALDEAVASARREAAGAFGDDRIFLERYVPRARHIEIQLLGDLHGNLVHLGERECSIQRRHQKIVEETPSSRIDHALREQMGEAALALGRSIGYESAGTVEFLLDDDSGEFFFLEVNTRLQVEHPVTEVTTGIDLVRQQLLVAAGHELELSQSDVRAKGHAIEVRLYAEDPANGFLPATGTVDAWDTPADRSVRWDAGIEAGSVVGVEYDPMLAKVIAHGPTRFEAAARLTRALENLHLGGLITNRDYLVTTLRTPEFLAGDTTTDFVDRVQPTADVQPELIQQAAIVAAMWRQAQNRRHDQVWGFAPSNWRNGGLAPSEISFSHRDLDAPVTLAYSADRAGRFRFESEHAPSEPVEVLDSGPHHVELLIGGLRRRHRITEGRGSLHVQMPTTTVTLDLVPTFVVPGSDLPSGGLVAPMPGAVVDVRCAVGDSVTAGQVLVVLEAMKMEHHVQSPIDGTVVDVLISVGQQLDTGAPLVSIQSADSAGEGVVGSG